MAFQILPPNAPLVDQNGKITAPWYRFLLEIQKLLGTSTVSPFDDSLLLTNFPTPVPSLEEVLNGETIGGATYGSATLNFGAFPGSNEASVSFADAAILAGSNVQAWFAANSTTADHTALDHRYAPLFIQLTALPTAGVGGTIYARSEHKMQGQWAVKYSWS